MINLAKCDAKRGGKHAFQHLPRTIRGQTLAKFWIEVSDVKVLEQRELRLDVEALETRPCPGACASPWRQPTLLARTHMRW